MYMSRVNINEINYFYTSVKKFPVTIKEPDEEVITSWNHPAYLAEKGHPIGCPFCIISSRQARTSGGMGCGG